jgi:hypothetical protein
MRLMLNGFLTHGADEVPSGVAGRALPPKADSSRTSRHVRFVPILLQKSKTERR